MSNAINLRESRISERLDRFYVQNGKCCAGCDWWVYMNSVVGDCTKSAPVPAGERWALLGLKFNKFVGAGHVVTPREHKCGDFKDAFDWSTLPASYLRKIGKTL